MGNRLKWEKVPRYKPTGHDPLRDRPRLDRWADQWLALAEEPKSGRKNMQKVRRKQTRNPSL